MAEQEGERRKPAKKILADTMTSREMAEHRRRDGILLLPVGCFEMHDMHVGLSCDTFSAEAVCRILAEEWDAVVLPPIHYTYPGATSRWPGSVAVRPREAMDYIAAVVKAIMRNGLRKLVVVNVHGPSQEIIEAALRQVFEETGGVPIHFDMDYGAYMRRIEEEFGKPHGEAAFYLAALYICGRHGEFDPAVNEEEAHPRDVPAFESMGKLWRRGAAGPYVFVTPWSHVGHHAGLTLDDAPRAAEILRECVLEPARGLPEDYEQFQRDMRRFLEEAPWDGV
jgi:creatinine amidohydrolase/Fe(II)-dependent formamide hydrolase-like protein